MYFSFMQRQQQAQTLQMHNSRLQSKCNIIFLSTSFLSVDRKKNFFNITSENHHLTADEQHNIGTFIYFLILSLARVKKKQKSKSRLGKINFAHMMKRMKVNFNAGRVLLIVEKLIRQSSSVGNTFPIFALCALFLPAIDAAFNL
ncbi:hypothetical protein T05_6626 [Trichinella murrelli]|uniref:Uncharacterized protein n=1 Tax=Trichinella murrelli TaxID=144512 RepID=A0A0V0TI15_9BILA|nr:hypothetical protein T05_6626 [Trichinella murrelli]